MRRGPRNSTPGLLATLVLLPACEPAQPTPSAPPSQFALEIDGGIGITREEITAFDAYFERLDRNLGHTHRRRVLFERHLLPLALARAGFPDLRSAAQESAADLASVAGNALELRRLGEVAGGHEVGPENRVQLPLPLTRWAVDESMIGAVSPPLELPDGVWVATLLDIDRGLTPAADVLTLYVVEFRAHSADSFTDWVAAQQARLTGKLLHCDPDLVNALPPWLAR